jgi:lipid-A-disaccharide synthase
MAQLSLMFIAGDPSGDAHAAAIIRRLRDELPGAELWGVGGSAMKREGFSPVMPFAPFNRMGYFEVAKHIVFFLRARRTLIAMMQRRKPAALVCIDYSGFNIPMMKAAKRAGIPVVWYIAPMVWAWKRRKAAVLGACAAHIAVIFPFEAPYFTPCRAKVTFVGNPTVEALEEKGAFLREPRRHPGNGKLRIALIPGSRRQEVDHLLPPMLEAFALLRKQFPRVTAVVSRYPGLPQELYRQAIGSAGIELFSGPLGELLDRTDCAMVTSGTATLEVALMGVPQVIAYRTSALTFAIAKRLVRIRHIGLPNIIAGEEIVPECIQTEANAESLSRNIAPFIASPERYNALVDRLVSLRKSLGEKKPSMEMTSILKTMVIGCPAAID